MRRGRVKGACAIGRLHGLSQSLCARRTCPMCRVRQVGDALKRRGLYT